MTLRNIALAAYAGADFLYDFSADVPATVDGEAVASGVDISDYTGALEIRRRDGEEVALTLTTAAAGLTLSATQGVISAQITVAQLADLLEVSERWWYRLTITSPEDVAYRIAEGPLTVGGWA